MMTAYTDIMEEDGMIIALAQEKAYGKNSHDYLIETLTHFNLPARFVNTVHALYENAYTRVSINGCLSSPFKVTGGV
jgi:hypothetical protein